MRWSSFKLIHYSYPPRVFNPIPPIQNSNLSFKKASTPKLKMKSSMLIGGMMAVANGAFLPSDNIPWKAYKKCGVRPNVQTIDEPTFGRRKREFDWLEYGNDLNGNIEEHIDLLSREKRDKMRADTRVS